MGRKMSDWLKRWGQAGSSNVEERNSGVLLISSGSSSDDSSSKKSNDSDYVEVAVTDTSVETDPSEGQFDSAVYTEWDHFTSLEIGGSVEADVPTPYGATGLVYTQDMVAIPTRHEGVEILVPSTEIIEISSDDTLTNSWDGESSHQTSREIPIPHVFMPGYGYTPYIPPKSSESLSEYVHPIFQTGPVEGEVNPAMQISEERLDLYGQPFADSSSEYNASYGGNTYEQGGTSAPSFGLPEERIPYEGKPWVNLNSEATVENLWWDLERDAERGGPIEPERDSAAELETFVRYHCEILEAHERNQNEVMADQVPVTNQNVGVVEEQVQGENLNNVLEVNQVETRNQLVEENPNQVNDSRVVEEHRDDDVEVNQCREETVAENEIPRAVEIGSIQEEGLEGDFVLELKREREFQFRQGHPCLVVFVEDLGISLMCTQMKGREEQCGGNHPRVIDVECKGTMTWCEMRRFDQWTSWRGARSQIKHLDRRKSGNEREENKIDKVERIRTNAEYRGCLVRNTKNGTLWD
ncbi:unnamed protein product [Microthlaspi erraticum]|uniref:Uncharacterized protein n=1 Tax=Microthlaspi erraticum TaxID=1685480 RepID=A0A6D2I7W8_9BRAS|nr:unnamed protein product [Microthlaspi erraticum]